MESFALLNLSSTQTGDHAEDRGELLALGISEEDVDRLAELVTSIRQDGARHRREGEAAVLPSAVVTAYGLSSGSTQVNGSAAHKLSASLPDARGSHNKLIRDDEAPDDFQCPLT